MACLAVVGCTLLPQTAQAPTIQHTPVLPKIVQPKTEPVLASRGEDFTITMYTAGPESTGKSPGDPAYGVTASGKVISKGDCACDEKYSFGTKFYVDGIGVVVCHDRGGAITGSHLDIYVDSLQRAIQFGKKTLQVRRLN